MAATPPSPMATIGENAALDRAATPFSISNREAQVVGAVRVGHCFAMIFSNAHSGLKVFYSGKQAPALRLHC